MWTQVTPADTDGRCCARRLLSTELHLLYPTPVMPSPSSAGPGSPPHGSRATSSWKPSEMFNKELNFWGAQSPPTMDWT